MLLSHIKHKGRLQKKEGTFQARTICTSVANDRPTGFFQASGFEINEEKKREVIVGATENVTLFGYYDEVPYIEGVIMCQLPDLEEAMEKLKELVKVISESL